MGVESPAENQTTDELVSLQDTLDSEQIAFVDTLDAEITTVIEQASTLQRYDYVIGTVDDGWISQNDHHHFEFVHHNRETDKDDQIPCVIFNPALFHHYGQYRGKAGRRCRHGLISSA